MDCDRRNVSLLDEEKCMVVEFVNENSEGEKILLAVGYQNWLTDEDKKNLPSIVERKTTVNVLWPNCDVKPVREMKKNVKGMTIWQNTAVKILGIGGWVDMCRLRKSFEKHDYVVVTKEDRRRVARKRGSSSTDEEERNPREECSTSQKIAKKKKTIPQQRESRKHRRGSKNASTCIEQDLWKQLRRNGNTAADCLGDDSSDSDVEENYKDVSKSQLILKVEIQAEEIRQLRSEVARLKSWKILNEGYVKKFFPTKEDEGQMRNGIKKKCNNISNMLKNKCIRKET